MSLTSSSWMVMLWSVYATSILELRGHVSFNLEEINMHAVASSCRRFLFTSLLTARNLSSKLTAKGNTSSSHCCSSHTCNKNLCYLSVGLGRSLCQPIVDLEQEKGSRCLPGWLCTIYSLPFSIALRLWKHSVKDYRRQGQLFTCAWDTFVVYLCNKQLTTSGSGGTIIL